MPKRIAQNYSNTQIKKYFGEDSTVIICDDIRVNSLLELILTSQNADEDNVKIFKCKKGH